jgi:molybdopterin molybdotransferase
VEDRVKIKEMDDISFSEALQRALENAPEIVRTEMVSVSSALGRIVAEDIYCRKNLPSFDNSAMDGFAVMCADAGKRVKVAGEIYAGDKPELSSLSKGECYRIMTGAPVPSGVESVVPVERCLDLSEDEVTLPVKVGCGDNIRKKGEEIERGSTLIEAGERLGFPHIAMLSAQGITTVKVVASPRIAVVSTGNEIREPWESAEEDEIYNANALGITALLESEGFDAVYAGSIPDDLEASVSFIANLKSYDVIISTGGISMGEADFLEEAYRLNGMREPLFHGVAVKPGRPTMMGLMDNTFVMAMPGNPLTTMLNIFLLSVPVLYRMQGARGYHYPFVTVENRESFGYKSFRANIVPGRIENGGFCAVRRNKIGSGMISPLMEADCVAIFEKGFEAPEVGDKIKVVMFSSKPSLEKEMWINRV